MKQIALAPIWQEATRRIALLPIYKGSHRGVDANEVGVLGEVAAEEWMKSAGISYVDRKQTTHDYLLSATSETLEIKTKDRTVLPRPHYECSVPLYNHEHQRPAWYLFVSLLRVDGPKDITKFTRAFIVGACQRDDLKNGVVWKAGDTDTNGTTFWTDCINVKIGDLTDTQKLMATWNKRSNGNG